MEISHEESGYVFQDDKMANGFSLDMCKRVERGVVARHPLDMYRPHEIELIFGMKVCARPCL